MSQHVLCRFLADLLPGWRKARRKVLALGTEGLLRKRRLTLTGIARGMDSTCRIIHRVKRLWRFTNNPAVDPLQVIAAVGARAFCLRPVDWVPVIMDETGIKDRAMLLGAAIAYHGRALPLALVAYSPRWLAKSIWTLREGVLATILERLEPAQRTRLLLVADRGFAASHFFRRLLAARVSFVIRVPRRVLLHMTHGRYCLETLAADLEHGDCHFLHGVRYGPMRAHLNVLLWWHVGQPEPWLLATTLDDPKQARNSYRLRMGVEEMFKDLKGHFALEACHLQTMNRITRVCLFLLLAVWALALLARYPSSWPRFATTRGALSFLSLALEWLDALPAIRHALRQGHQSG